MPSEFLTPAEVAKAIGVSEDWVWSHRFRLPAEVKIRDGSMQVARTDLPEWKAAACPRETRTAQEPTWRHRELMERCQATAARFGDSGWRP